jgi:hypothetical protein
LGYLNEKKNDSNRSVCRAELDGILFDDCEMRSLPLRNGGYAVVLAVI